MESVAGAGITLPLSSGQPLVAAALSRYGGEAALDGAVLVAA
jgi:hypothetical protein